MLQMLTRALLTKPVLSLQKKVWGMVEKSSTCTSSLLIITLSMRTRKQAPSKNRDGGCHLGKSAVVLLKNTPEEICVRFDSMPNSMQE